MASAVCTDSLIWEKLKKLPAKITKRVIVIIALALIFLFYMHYEEIPILFHQESAYNNIQIFS